MKWIRNIVLLSLLSAPVWGDKLFIRNKPFLGASMGVGVSRMVELEPLAKALGFTVKPLNGGFLVTTDPNSDQGSEICEAGSAVVDGNKLSLITGTGGQNLISLSEFCSSVGAKLVVNSEMGSTDVYMESNAKSRGPSLKDKWGVTGQAEKGQGSRSLPDGPGKVSVQLYEAFGLLPAIRDLKEYRTLNLKSAEVARFKSALQNLCTPELFQKIYPRMEKSIEQAMQGSLALSQVPADEFERYVSSKPELAKKFTENIAAWEELRSFSATLLEQKSDGRQAIVMLEVLHTDPLTNQTTKNKVLLALIRAGVNRWKIAEREVVE
ncbi:hypothetical protein JST97_15650 [bacterium]|nr:hypothetical protein [bacterium]